MNLLPPFLRRLFRREEGPRADGDAEELWNPDILEAGEGRFVPESGESWRAEYMDGRLELELGKTGLFAWAEAHGHNYYDFVAEGEILLPSAPTYGAAGFLFRYVDERNFYLLLLSNRGYFRLDNVFNGTPRPLIAWTEIAERLLNPGAPAALRVIARGTALTVMVDGAWVGETSDDTARSGSLAFAAQLYDEGRPPVEGSLRFALASIFVESRPLEVETLYRRFALMDGASASSRRALAETFLAMGHYLPAAVQLKKLEKERVLSAEEFLLKAEISIRLDLLDEAAEAIDASLALDPLREEALLEKANLLYRCGRYQELGAFIEGLPDGLREGSRAAILLGHARFNLGDYEGAALAYGRAAALEPEQPLLKSNEARAWEQAGKNTEAIQAYLAAAKGFFAAEAREELELAEGRLRVLGLSKAGLRGIRARSLYLAGRKEEAALLIDAEILEGCGDSTLHYLGGLIRLAQGKRVAALPYFEGAWRLEPSAALFAWRRAETLYLLDRPEAREAIAEALQGHPDDGWTLNLAGQLVLEGLKNGTVRGASGEGGGEPPQNAESLNLARTRLERAVALLPGRSEPLQNLAELFSLEGRTEEALRLLEGMADSPGARNQGGNILVRAAKSLTDREEAAELFARAETWYRRAIELDATRAEFHENLAALLIEVGRWSDAEEEIRRSLDLGSHPRAYLLAGNLAEVYGDFPRAEASYRIGLDGSPGNTALIVALGRLRITLRRWDRARDCVKELESLAPELAKSLEAEIVSASTEGIACAACDRSWRVPRDLPAQSASTIRGMPPDEAPAGACPRCGKIYCIGCRRQYIVENRFTCPDCGENLKITDNRLRWLVREEVEKGHA